MNQTAMQKGREKALKVARRESIKRVRVYRAWLAEDVAVSKQRRQAADQLSEDEIAARYPRPRMPAIPSKHDFEIADGRAAA